MEMNQAATLVNSAYAEAVGGESVLSEDLSNTVDIGDEIFNANAVDAYVKSLVNHVGRVVFVNRPYAGGTPSVLMDGWEFGSVLEKISAKTPVATENESWELTDGTSYDPNVFYQPHVSAKFFNKRVTFEVPMSFTELQVKQSFSSAAQLNGFLSMLYNAVDRAMTVRLDALIMRTINNMIGETVYADYADASLSSKSGIKAVNLLYLYNQTVAQADQLTASEALLSPEFIRFAAYQMGLYTSRLSKISTLFNVGGEDRFTPSDLLHVVMLADFRKAANVFLQSDVFHDQFTQLPNAEEVPFWQGSGTDYDFSHVSEVKITTASEHSVDVTGVLGVMFDRDALGVCCADRRVTTNYNPKAEFYSNWYKWDAGYFNDLNENFVVFFVA